MSASEAALPLRLRVPNGTPFFVARERELDALAHALAGAPLVLLTGPEGAGKTALALELVARDARATPRVYVRCEGLAPASILDAVARGLGASDEQRLAMGASLEHALAWVLDRADADASLVLLDDCDAADPTLADALLAPLALYARRARWLVLSRARPGRPLEVPQLALEPLSTDALHRLAERFAPALDEAQRQNAVARCAGSPCALRRLLDRGGSHQDSAEARASLLALLGALHTAVPPALLEPADPAATPALLGALEREGIVVRDEQGVRLHELGRSSAGTADAAGLRALAQALGHDAEPEHQLEALRLFLAAGALEEAAALVQRSRAALCQGVHALALWTLLQDPRVPRGPSAPAPWHLARLRAALACGLAGSLDEAEWRIEPPDDPELAVACAECALECYAPEVCAAHLAAPCLDRAPLAETQRARVLRARVLSRSGAAVAALELLSDLEPVEPRTRLDAAVLRGGLLAKLGRFDEALALVPRILAWPECTARVRAQLAMKLAFLCRFDESERLLAPLLPTASPDVLLYALYVFADAGLAASMQSAVAMLGERTCALEPYRSVLARLRVPVTLLDADLEPFPSRLDRALRSDVTNEARASLSLDAMSWAVLRALPALPAWLEDARFEREDYLAACFHLERERWRLRAGQRAADADTRAPAQVPAGTWASVREHLLRAETALVRGDVSGAVACARQTLDEAARSGLPLLRAEALGGLCDALLCADEHHERVAHAQALAALAERMGASRFAAEARWHLALRPRAMDVVALHALLEGRGSVAARRAAALLGLDAPLDRVDAAVLSRVRASLPAPRWIGEGPERLWYDANTGALVLPTGVVSLGARAVQRALFEALLAHEGRASKERLVLAVWRVRSYSPLRDDKRLQVAVRALRATVEAAPSAPELWQTTEGGYALGPRFRVLLVGKS